MSNAAIAHASTLPPPNSRLARLASLIRDEDSLTLANALTLLDLAYERIKRLEADLATCRSLERSLCMQDCKDVARDYSAEGEQDAGFGALRCAEAIAKRGDAG